MLEGRGWPRSRIQYAAGRDGHGLREPGNRAATGLAAVRRRRQNRCTRSPRLQLMVAQYASFREFYPFYLSEHANRTCRRLHFAGSTLVLLVLLVACASQRWLLLALLPLLGYGFAWVGHFFFEHNRPATFTYPFYSFAGDWVMYWQIISGRIPF